MYAKYPGVTAFDELMFLEGWNRAEQWALYTTGTAGKEKALASVKCTYLDEARALHQAMCNECWGVSADESLGMAADAAAARKARVH